MVKYLFLILISSTTYAQSYRFGLLTPIPFNIPINKVDVGSFVGQVTMKNGIQGTAGYLRFENFSAMTAAGGYRYKKKEFYVGLNGGFSLINEMEPKENFYRFLWMPYIGWQRKRWSVDMLYLNWEEFDDKNNTLTLYIGYNL